MSDLSLMRYQGDLKNQWDGVVQQSKNGNFLHLRDYMEYHAHRFDEQSVLIERKGKIIAAFPCNRIENKIISHGGLTYAGLIYGSGLHAVDVLEVFTLLVDHYKAMGCDKLTYKATPHIFHRYPAEEDLYALSRMNARMVRRDISSVIQLNNRLKLSDSRKCTIRKAVKQGVEVREGSFFDDYYELLSQVLSKFGLESVHTLQELKLLHNRFPNNIRLFGAFKKNRLLAGAIVYDFGHVAHTQYLASSDVGRGTGALDYVLKHLLDNVFSNYQYFSFGISTEQNGQHLNSGLIFQKEGFGGRGIVHDHYELEL